MPARLLLVFALLFAFTIQSFVTETHIHPAGYGQPTLLQHPLGGADKPANLPSGDDSSNCPLCKEISLGGQFVGPGWLVLAVPVQPVSLLNAIAVSLPPAIHAPFRWRSRAPPGN